MAEENKSVLSFLQNDTVESVLMWEQPVTSGLALASITAAFFLLEKSGFTLIALTANILLVAVLGVFVWSNVATVLNLPPPPVQSIEIDVDQAKLLAEKVATSANSVLASICAVLTGKDAASTLKLAGILYAIAKVGSYFHSATLLYLIALCFFSLPKVYVLKKKQIDEAVAIAAEYVNKYYAIVKAAVMEKVKALKPKPKEESKKTE